MKNSYKLFIFTFITLFSFSQAIAREYKSDDTLRATFLTHNYYTAGAFDAAIFSSATMQRPGYMDRMGTLRFTLFVNLGATFHYDINNSLGFFTGLDVKNVGFIEKRNGDSTVKRRTYNLGVPLGVKFGNMNRRRYVFAGVGLDMPFNYKEKGFVSRSNKQKIDEWFSTRTPTFMPYAFVGVSVKRRLTVKLQYYMGNFLNPDYQTTQNGVTVAPYAGYDVHLILLSFGHTFHYRDHNNVQLNEAKLAAN